MADISDRPLRTRKRAATGRQPSEPPVHSSVAGLTGEAAAIAMIELMFFAYRDFTSDPDAILETYGFGRAHHRVLHFVDRNPGLRVADLLDILKIRKQSLARVLKQLVEDGFIERQAGAEDQRERLLFTTERGRDLAQELLRTQIARVGTALGAEGSDDFGLLCAFLLRMVGAGERDKVANLVARSHKAAAKRRDPPALPSKERP